MFEHDESIQKPGFGTTPSGFDPSRWQNMETAPRDGTVFLALNHDREAWVAKFEERFGRLCFRHNVYRECRRFIVHNIDGKRLLEEDEEYARQNSGWSDNWSLWTKGLEFKPTHWLPLPRPPRDSDRSPKGGDQGTLSAIGDESAGREASPEHNRPPTTGG